MRDNLEQLLRSADVPNQERAQLLWEDYRTGADSPDPGRKAASDAAFTTLLAWYGQSIYRRVWGFVRSDLAEDVFQEILAELHRKRQRLATFEDAHNWLRATADRRSKDALRKASRRKAREAKAARPDNDSSDMWRRQRSELQQALAVAISQLVPEQQQAVALHYFEGMEKKAAAAVLGVNRDTLAARLNAALEKLQKLVPVPTVLAAGGTAGLSTALAEELPAISSIRLSELASAALVRAGTSSLVLVKLAAVALLALALGSAAVASWAASRDPEPEAPHTESPRIPAAAPVLLPETLQARNIRLFDQKVRPPLNAVLNGLCLGTGGEVRITSIEADASRVFVEAEIRHGAEFGFTTRLWIGHDMYDLRGNHRDYWVMMDMAGTGRYASFHPRSVVRLKPGSSVKWQDSLSLKSMTALADAFDQLPSDPRSAAEISTLRKEMDRVVSRFAGDWVSARDGRPVCHIEYHPPKRDGFPLVFTYPRREPVNGRWLCIRPRPDGRVAIYGIEATGPLLFSSDGSRAEVSGTGEVWVRGKGIK